MIDRQMGVCASSFVCILNIWGISCDVFFCSAVILDTLRTGPDVVQKICMDLGDLYSLIYKRLTNIIRTLVCIFCESLWGSFQFILHHFQSTSSPGISSARFSFLSNPQLHHLRSAFSVLFSTWWTPSHSKPCRLHASKQYLHHFFLSERWHHCSQIRAMCLHMSWSRARFRSKLTNQADSTVSHVCICWVRKEKLVESHSTRAGTTTD